MSMGFKPCMCCSSEAEALYAVDGMIEYYCPECQTQWAEEPEADYYTGQQYFNWQYYGEE